MRRLALSAIVACLGLALGAATGSAATCNPVKNPYADTRYDGINLSHIRADGVGCEEARKVARRAHSKALGTVPSANGIVRLRWHGWKVTGDLRPSSDRYKAKRHGAKVRWRF